MRLVVSVTRKISAQLIEEKIVSEIAWKAQIEFLSNENLCVTFDNILDCMHKIFLILFLFSSSHIFSQQRLYTTANAHSHNDYEKPLPFVEAYNQQFGSIEADVFLIPGSNELFVAHYRTDIDKKKRTLDSLYLVPLANRIRQNKGFVYADTTRTLQLMIDIKTEALKTLDRLINILQKYPDIIHSRTLKLVISGNRPAADSFYVYPSFIQFDGVVGTEYPSRALSKIAMMSAPFTQFSKWNGRDTIPVNDKAKFVSAIASSHRYNKPIRFWGAPDTNEAWSELIRLGVDYINTDRIADLSGYLKNNR